MLGCQFATFDYKRKMQQLQAIRQTLVGRGTVQNVVQGRRLEGSNLRAHVSNALAGHHLNHSVKPTQSISLQAKSTPTKPKSPNPHHKLSLGSLGTHAVAFKFKPKRSHRSKLDRLQHNQVLVCPFSINLAPPIQAHRVHIDPFVGYHYAARCASATRLWQTGLDLFDRTRA